MSGRTAATLLVGCIVIAAICVLSSAGAQTPQKPDGAQAFAEYCAGCHGADGKGGDKAASIATTLSVLSRSDAELIRIIEDGTTQGMPPFAQIGDENVSAVVRYLRVLERQRASEDTEPAVTGDVSKGRALYFGSAGCSACHMIRGEGGFIAPDLTPYARTHSPDAILQAITNPEGAPSRSARVVDVTLRAGQTLTGVLRYEDSFNLTIQTQDGRYHFLNQSELRDVHYTGRSLMPRDYASRISSKELIDLVSFLVVTAKTGRRTH